MTSEIAAAPAVPTIKEPESAPAARYVPGAPPSTKSLIKKKRAKSGKSKSEKDGSVLDTRDDDAKDGSVAADSTSAAPAEANKEKKPPSPIVEMINKRIKPVKKKILRIAPNKGKPESSLNEDQKAALASLPALEASVKEAEEIMKAVENLENELDNETTLEKKKQEQVHQDQLRGAVAATEAQTIPKVALVLSLVALSSSLQSLSPSVSVDELEQNALSRAASILLGQDAASKEQIIAGLLNENSVGEVDGVTYFRLRELAREFSAPPSAPSPVQDHIDDIDEAAAEQPAIATTSDIPAAAPTQSFSFMQESELEGSGTQAGDLTFGNVSGLEASMEGSVTQDWVNVQNDVVSEGEKGEGSAGSAPEQITAPEDYAQATIVPEPLPQAPIDWAADDNEGLPSIDTLHAKFGTSGDATPVESMSGSAPPAPAAIAENLATPGTPPNEWRTPNPGRARRGGSGFRGGPPGDREGGSGFRGRGRGFRGNGEYRGRGRGGHSGDGHSSAPPTPMGDTPDENGWRTQGPRPRGSGFRSRGGSGFRGRGGPGNQPSSNPPPAAP